MICFFFRRFSGDLLLFSGGFLVICCIFRRFSSDLLYFQEVFW